MRCHAKSPSGWLPSCFIRKCLTLVLAVGGAHGYAPRVDQLLARRGTGRARFTRTLVMASYSTNSSTPSSAVQPKSPKPRKNSAPEPLPVLPDIPPEAAKPPSRRPTKGAKAETGQRNLAPPPSPPPPPPPPTPPPASPEGRGGRLKVVLHPDGEERVYLHVPFAEKDQVKALGARWDASRRAWYVHPSKQPLCERWLPPASPQPPRNKRTEPPTDPFDDSMREQGPSTFRPRPSNPRPPPFSSPSPSPPFPPPPSSPQQRIFLNVPFADKDLVKSLGARWDTEAKQWYIPSSSHKTPLSAFTPWMDDRGPLTSLPNEDRTFGGNELCVDLIPSTCWFTNVRSALDAQEWTRLRRLVVTRTQGQCECCQRVAPGLEAHERWQYVTDNPFALHPRRIQKLKRLVALCRECHEVTHMGLAQLQGRGEEAITHLRRVTRMSATEAEEHVHEAFDLWARRSRVEWELDVSLLTDNGIPLKEEVAREERSRRAQQELRRRGAAGGDDQGETWM